MFDNLHKILKERKGPFPASQDSVACCAHREDSCAHREDRRNTECTWRQRRMLALSASFLPLPSLQVGELQGWVAVTRTEGGAVGGQRKRRRTRVMHIELGGDEFLQSLKKRSERSCEVQRKQDFKKEDFKKHR